MKIVKLSYVFIILFALSSFLIGQENNGDKLLGLWKFKNKSSDKVEFSDGYGGLLMETGKMDETSIRFDGNLYTFYRNGTIAFTVKYIIESMNDGKIELKLDLNKKKVKININSDETLSALDFLGNLVIFEKIIQ